MDNVIQRLVEVDRECVKRVEEAKAKKLDAQANMSSKRQEIYDDFVLQHSNQIEKHKASLMDKNKADALLLEQKYQDTLVKLDNIYQENKDRWVDEIVSRCLK